ncbi:hypothetical protein VSO92_13280 [Myroides pelagicus]|uniref:hypothetical protein n=1 Tax=Myroides pelagicus TaxID=270914 RepID=UPI002DBDE60C|nr:hypothetical protein [Myroides pelagicus]MEC4115072.1 hypothetical protein [Myroides pelagicus]
MLDLENGYFREILLVFGQASLEKRESLQTQYIARCNQERIKLIFHDAPLTRAHIID